MWHTHFTYYYYSKWQQTKLFCNDQKVPFIEYWLYLRYNFKTFTHSIINSFNPYINQRARNYYLFYSRKQEPFTPLARQATEKCHQPLPRKRSKPIFKFHYRLKEKIRNALLAYFLWLSNGCENVLITRRLISRW